ncbi:MAG: electron transfer flavoprotein subunit alpha/FixB family protein [Anaerolineae bacterium]
MPATLEALGQARDLADQIGVYVFGLILGPGAGEAAETLIAYGADKVLVLAEPGSAADAALAGYQPEVYVQALAGLVEQQRPEILFLPATPLGNDLAPRLAQRLGTGLMSHCVKLGLDMSERLLLGTFRVMGGEVYHTVTCPEGRPQMATLEPGYFRLPYEDAYRSGDVQTVDVELDGVSGRLTWLDAEASIDLPPATLDQARVVVAAGRGMGDAEGFALVEQLANALGGVVAGTRGALDAGWVEEEQVVGVGGEFVAPDLYVACGLSGDIYHHFGLQEAKFIVAINNDEQAPIRKMANMAVVGDAKEIVAAMLDALEK